MQHIERYEDGDNARAVGAMDGPIQPRYHVEPTTETGPENEGAGRLARALEIATADGDGDGDVM